MGRNLERRRSLFKKFSRQLLLLKEHGYIDRNFKYGDPYLCPICLREFSEDHLDENKYRNFLTAEDAPPAALGGSKIALTCRECNNNCGKEIDCHLSSVLRAIDDSYFYKGTKQSAMIEFENKKLTVELESLGDGILTAYHRIIYNNPTLLERFIYGIKNKSIGPILNIIPPARKLDPQRIDYALVKTNYILTFAKFGYIFLLSEQYDKLREQLLKPFQSIFPWTPFIKNQFKRESTGTYYIQNKNLEAILNIFVLKTDYSETVIGGFTQPPGITIEAYGKLIDQSKGYQGMLEIDTSFYDAHADLFCDIAEINKVRNWIGLNTK
ncbi:hypothetical protein [Sphingobacterium thalpophilum]|uniref:HNH endonuclease 5 domain-containing protein n=1 Tax=Sphingobacterium thalpophilum TaxID=259 RepID=A0A4U9UCJ7_9SPHI|nr:hypothetical protein [Sphingobacterium thalpophilum]VTR29679.1 Uncharacterised protein [Sphingobacterium thalpophilum]